MCLAIVKPAKATIPEAHLHAGWLANSNGAGFAYVDKGEVVIKNKFMKYKEFLEAYSEAAQSHKKSTFLVHFRITSQGDSSADNTHPFPIRDGALIHNGTIYGTGASYNKGPSDTNLFARRYFNVLTYEFVSKHRKDLEELLDYNKIAILYKDNTYQILNMGKGEWKDDVWYSNPTYKPSARRTNVITGGYVDRSTGRVYNSHGKLLLPHEPGYADTIAAAGELWGETYE
jgi:predicted glutamine amidotransferase